MSEQEMLKCEPCREFQNYVKRIDANGIYVSELPPRVTEEDLYRFFSRWGKIADMYFPDSGQYCLVHFEDRRPVDDLVSYPVALYGREINVRPRFVSKDDLDAKASLNLVPPLHEAAFKSVSSGGTFQEQVQSFLKQVAADESLFRRHTEVCEDLKDALKDISSHYSIIPFGSSVNGLAFKDSDIDIFYGRESKANGFDVKDVFRKARAALEENRLFTSLKPIPSARVPIIKFVHKSTGVKCDLSFRNTMGVQNSKLIKFLMSLDDRIQPFFMIVKYWAKIHHLTGKRMSNYGLILLLINFLQSLQNPLLPQLVELQHSGVAASKVGVWNVGFDDDVTRLRPVSNDLPLEELLSRFFESVGKTDFANYVVCPLAGSLIHRRAFRNTSSLPPELKNYAFYANTGRVTRLKVESVLCLQDPIELNLNVTKNVAKHDFQHFSEHCQIAARLSYSVPPHLFLSHLFSTSFVYPQQETKRTWHPNPMHVRPLRPYLTLNIPSPETLSDDISWRKELIEQIIIIFKKVLKIYVDPHKKGDEKPGSDQTLVCKGSQVLWVGRDRLWKKWYRNRTEDIEVLDISGDSESMSNGKRKRKEDDDAGEDVTKRRKLLQSNEIIVESSNDQDVIVLDDDETNNPPRESRSIQQEIDLTNNMVKQGHALPAVELILNFTCYVSKVNNGVCIELSDHRSRSSYFSSLCIFLEDFLCKHLISAETSSN